MARIKKQLVEVPTKEQLPDLMKGIALNQSALKKIEAEIEQKITKIRNSYADKIQDHREVITENTSKLEAFALQNRDMFDKKKSMDLSHGKIGFRVGNPKVAFERGFAKKALGLVNALGMTNFIRQKEELDKEKIVSSRNDEDIMKKLKTAGIKVEQKETFFAEPKEELIELT